MSALTDCRLSFELAITHSPSLFAQLSLNDGELSESILSWMHQRLFDLITASFVYDVDRFTDDFWDEYRVHFTSVVGAEDNDVVLLYGAVCVAFPEIHDIIAAELTNDADEIAAFVRHEMAADVGLAIQEDDLTVSLELVAVTQQLSADIATTNMMVTFEHNATESTMISDEEIVDGTTGLQGLVEAHSLWIVIGCVGVFALALMALFMYMRRLKRSTEKVRFSGDF